MFWTANVDQEWVWTNCFSVCGAEQEAAKSSGCCPSDRDGEEEGEGEEEEEEEEEAGFNARSVQAAGAHIFAQCCMSNRLLTLRRICFPSAEKKKKKKKKREKKLRKANRSRGGLWS